MYSVIIILPYHFVFICSCLLC